MDLSGLSDDDLMAIEAGDMGKVSEMGLNVLTGKSSVPGSPLAPPNVMERALGVSPEDRLTIHEHGVQRDQRQDAFRQAPGTDKLKALLGFKQDLMPQSVAGVPPSFIPAAGGAGAMLGKVGEAISKTAPRRLAASTVAGGIKGAIDPNKTAGEGAAEGLGFGVLGEAAGGAASLASKGATYLGRKIGGLSPKLASAYQQFGDKTDDMFRQMQEAPDQFQADTIARNRALVDELQQKEIDPKLAKLQELLVGKGGRVQRDQFQGTAAGNVLDDAWTKMAPTKQGSVRATQVYQPKFTPVSSTQKVVEQGEQTAALQPKFIERPDFKVGATRGGNFDDLAAATAAREAERQQVKDMMMESERQYAGSTQGVNPYDTSRQIPIGEVQKSIIPTGPEQRLPNVPIDRQLSFKYQPTAPEQFSVEGNQLLRARRASAKASQGNYRANPQAYSAADDMEAAAASRLGKAVDNIVPGASALDDAASKAIRVKEGIKRLGNPANILKEGESLGSMPMSSVQDYLDKTLGTSLLGQSQSLAASQKLGGQDSVWRGDLAKALLNRAKSPQEAAEILRMLNPAYQGSAASANALNSGE